jgi:hypothetical protein
LYVDFQLSSNEYGNSLVINKSIGDTSNVFVYGTEVNDLTTIDKSYIYTLNVCATQILSEKISQLQQENTDLQSYVEQLENRLLAIKDMANNSSN